MLTTTTPAESPEAKGDGKFTPETSLRIEKVCDMLLTCRHKGQLRAKVRQEFGVSRSTADRYLRAARRTALKAIGRSREEMLADSVAFWESMVYDPKASAETRMKARNSLDRLLGLRQPIRVAVSEELPEPNLDEMLQVISGADAKLESLGLSTPPEVARAVAAVREYMGGGMPNGLPPLSASGL